MRGVEPERDAGEEPDLGVGRFDESLGEAVVEVGVDGLFGVWRYFWRGRTLGLDKPSTR